MREHLARDHPMLLRRKALDKVTWALLTCAKCGVKHRRKDFVEKRGCPSCSPSASSLGRRGRTGYNERFFRS